MFRPGAGLVVALRRRLRADVSRNAVLCATAVSTTAATTPGYPPLGVRAAFQWVSRQLDCHTCAELQQRLSLGPGSAFLVSRPGASLEPGHESRGPLDGSRGPSTRS